MTPATPKAGVTSGVMGNLSGVRVELYVDGLSELVGEAPLMFEITAVVESAVGIAEVDVDVDVELEVGFNVAKVDLERSVEVLSLPLLSVCVGLSVDTVATADSVLEELVGPSCLCCRSAALLKCMQKHSSISKMIFDRIVYTIVTRNCVHGITRWEGSLESKEREG